MNFCGRFQIPCRHASSSSLAPRVVWTVSPWARHIDLCWKYQCIAHIEYRSKTHPLNDIRSNSSICLLEGVWGSLLVAALAFDWTSENPLATCLAIRLRFLRGNISTKHDRISGEWERMWGYQSQQTILSAGSERVRLYRYPETSLRPPVPFDQLMSVPKSIIDVPQGLRYIMFRGQLWPSLQGITRRLFHCRLSFGRPGLGISGQRIQSIDQGGGGIITGDDGDTASIQSKCITVSYMSDKRRWGMA